MCSKVTFVSKWTMKADGIPALVAGGRKYLECFINQNLKQTCLQRNVNLLINLS